MQTKCNRLRLSLQRISAAALLCSGYLIKLNKQNKNIECIPDGNQNMRIGLDCSLMMQCPGIVAEECLNWQTCGAKMAMDKDDIRLLRVREEARVRWLE